MVEEETPKPTKEEEKKNFLKEIREEREALKLEREEAEKATQELKEAKALDTISGKADGGQAPEVPKEKTPEEYVNEVLDGKIEDAS